MYEKSPHPSYQSTSAPLGATEYYRWVKQARNLRATKAPHWGTSAPSLSRYYISHNHINNSLYQSNTAYLNSLFDLGCVILVFGKPIAFKKEQFSPAAPQTKGRRGTCASLSPMSGVSGLYIFSSKGTI